MTDDARNDATADEAHEDELVDWFDDEGVCRNQPPSVFLDDVASKAGLLVREPHDARCWRFRHRAFREVLCAQALVDEFDGNAAALATKAASQTDKEPRALGRASYWRLMRSWKERENASS